MVALILRSACKARLEGRAWHIVWYNQLRSLALRDACCKLLRVRDSGCVSDMLMQFTIQALMLRRLRSSRLEARGR
jgi:hypothetical protein